MFAPDGVYGTSGDRPERRGVSRRTVIEEANAKVSTISLAGLLVGPGELSHIGDEWKARCPLPDHKDRTPSFYVNPNKDLWCCHGCQSGGDVVELARLTWGYEKSEVATAAARLLWEFGHEIPQRPAKWFAKQKRQKSVREKMREVRVEIMRRQLFRIIILPIIKAATSDEREFREEVTRAWCDFSRVPVENLLDRYDDARGY